MFSSWGHKQDARDERVKKVALEQGKAKTIQSMLYLNKLGEMPAKIDGLPDAEADKAPKPNDLEGSKDGLFHEVQ